MFNINKYILYKFVSYEHLPYHKWIKLVMKEKQRFKQNRYVK